MATRRSRIKAVANLPARRNRPLNSDVKKEDADSTEDVAENLAPSSHPPQLVISPGPSENNDSSSSDKPLDSNILTESPAINTDRKSVIVSVEKDRKSVIVNRSFEKVVATSTETELNSVKKSGDSSSGKGKNAKGTKVDDNQSKKTASNQPKSNSSSHTLYGSAEKSPNLLGDGIGLGRDKKTTGNVPKTSDEIHQESAPSSQNVLQLGEGNCESSASSTIRGPLRGRRPKPVVNLTAASRKRPASDAVSSTPCSPPVQKTRTLELIHHNGSESDHDGEASASASCGERSEANGFKDLSSKIQSPPIPMSPPPVPVNHSSLNTLPSQCSSIAKNKTLLNGIEPCSSGAVTPVTPQKDSSSTTKRKQSSSALKAAAARKNFKSRFNSERPPPRSALTMFDLIFYNPSKNPMKSAGPTSSVKARSRQTSISSISSVHEDRLNEEAVDDLEEEKKIEEDEEEEEQEETTMPVPRVKVGPDGSLILDEQSLVIETTGAKKIREEMEQSEVVIDTGSSYGHYKRTKRSKDWSDNETKKFYRALNVVGTDFSLMKPLFRTRTRRELKLKFKKEERLNPSLVNKALGEHLDFDVTELEKECELEEEEEKRIESLAKEKDVTDVEKTTTPKQPRSKKKPSNPRFKKSRLSVEIEGDLQEEVVNKNSEPSAPKASTSVTPCLKKRPSKKKKKLTSADVDYQSLSEGVALVPIKGKRNVTRRVRGKDDLSKEMQAVTVAEESVKGTKKLTLASQSCSNTAFNAPEICNPSSRNSCLSSSALSPKHSGHTEVDGNVSECQILKQQGNVPSATPSSSTSVKTPNSTTSTSKLVYRIVQNVNTPPSQQFRIVHTPPQTSQVGGTAFSTPASRLMPSPNLPRMEPGSLIVLKTPIPENPDRHILQVYMVTNTPPASSTSAPQVLHAPILPGIHVLPAPSATLAKAPSGCVSSDSDSEKVLTTL